jgi:CheY-like chemotaxis protein/pSer/pThr/pTyr-binding forkhead associated (FHA) protein
VAKAQILVVEDDTIVVMELQDRLQSFGYAVSAVASSGEEAIKKAGDKRPDLVLMDIRLKGEMDGIEAALEIWARFDIPVIYLTALADEGTLQRAKITEPYGYIVKPFEEKTLHSAIEIALHKRKMEALRSMGDKGVKTREPVETIQPEIREVDRVGVKPPPPPIAERVPELRERPEAGLFSLLMLEPTKRRIALPTSGEIVLGRFNLEVGFFPDIDLSYEDQDLMAISRRHAKIYSDGNVHYVEDLGSTNGTRVNVQMLQPGQKHRLRQGDRIAMGNCLLVYGPTPRWLLNPPSHVATQSYLLVTPSARRIDLPEQGELIIGRSEPAGGFVPDIDLHEEGEISERVAPRHVKMIYQRRIYSLEDLGSPHGTKINGMPVLAGQTIQLNPSDHIWLGGCVLAYDIEIKIL